MEQTAKEIIESIGGKVQMREGMGIDWIPHPCVFNYIEKGTLPNGVEIEFLPQSDQPDCWEMKTIGGGEKTGYHMSETEKLKADILRFSKKKPVKIINLTQHKVEVRNNYRIWEYPPSGDVARVATNSEIVDTIDDIEIVSQSYGEIQGLPEPQKDTLFIVSMVVRQAAPHRKDIVSPDSSPQSAVRDSEGKIMYVRRFAR